MRRRLSREVLLLGFFIFVVLSVFVTCQPSLDAVKQSKGDPDSSPLFSPDSSTIAYVYSAVYTGWSGLEPRYKAESAGVCWCTATQPTQEKAVLVDSMQLSGERAWLGEWIHMLFSPDSKHLGLVWRKGIKIIDLSSGQCRNVVEESAPITSFAWLSEREIVYVIKGDPRLFCRQDITEPNDQRKVFHKEPPEPDFYPDSDLEHPYPDDWPVEYWSYDGRYAVYRSEERFKLLDLQTGRKQLFGKRQEWTPVVAMSWKQDNSAVFCVSGEKDRGYQALVLSPQTGEVLDFSRDFNAAFGAEDLRSGLSRPGDTTPMTRWTADGRYFVVNSYRQQGGFLVCPRPWEVIPLGDRIRELLGPPPVNWDVERPYFPSAYIQPTPIIGWVLSDPQYVGRDLLVDYEGRLAVDIPTYDWMGVKCGPVVSPDGSLIAVVTSSNRMTVTRTPALSVGTQPTSRLAPQ